MLEIVLECFWYIVPRPVELHRTKLRSVFIFFIDLFVAYLSNVRKKFQYIQVQPTNRIFVIIVKKTKETV